MAGKAVSVERMISGLNQQVDERTKLMYNPESMSVAGYAQISPGPTRNRNMILFHTFGGQREVA